VFTLRGQRFIIKKKRRYFMKKALIFETRSGTVEECAHLLKEKIQDIEVINLKKDKPDLSKYDLVVFGGAYYAGMLSGKLKKLIKRNRQALKSKKYAIYVCCISQDDYKEVLIKNLGKELVDNAVAVELFGYQVNPQKTKCFNRFVLKVIKKAFEKENKPLSAIKEDSIDAFAKAINQA